MRNLEVRFKRAPATPRELEVVPAEAPRLANGGILCRARWLAVDPLRCRFEGPATPGEVVPALGVYEVIESRNDVFTVGQSVVLDCGMREICASDGRHAFALHPGHSPPWTALGVLGPPGMAAYFGLIDLAGVRPSETVLIAAASGVAGATAGQMAAIKGARAIGIDDTAEKCAWATRHARFATCINSRTESLSRRLWQLAPQGFDIFFDAGSGELLDALLAGQHLAPGARVILGPYDPGHASTGHEHPAAQAKVRILRLSLRDYEHRRAEFFKDAIAWYGADRLVCRQDVIDGLESAPAQLDRMLRGEHCGQVLVKV
jgi:NADPH-dependent curcumin reductase CurA